ncbi:hypothetical protein MJO28_012334 [Puccinia striiformis f. sp. tritici]|uniref:FIT family protein scs3 n=2 Tax=Puccinia striiformis TaxID=27350 RepID=A0A2S4V539_9BASI|nr:hypothetical protein MJO28_012334 [Puccinia striiformis f. sp. tritici]POW04607.1 hypothetical protein PSTT_10227 [Puccinia striiformis]
MGDNTKSIIIILLSLTITIGTYQSFSIYSADNPEIPIHQLTRIPATSLVSTHTTNLKSTTTTLPYFANKNNFFNQKLVKLAWAWTSFAVWFHSLSIASFYYGHHSDPKLYTKKQQLASKNHPSNHVRRILCLHLVASTVWICLTQWFFGSSLIERVLILSGATCVPSLKPALSTLNINPQPAHLENLYCQHRWGRRLPGLDQFILSTYKPYWSEGFDISGHTFLLSFSILLIISSITPSLRHLYTNQETKEDRLINSRNWRIAIYCNMGLCFIWWWMILMTSLYFHGPVEKFSGLGTGVGAWLFVEYIVDCLLGPSS